MYLLAILCTIIGGAALFIIGAFIEAIVWKMSPKYRKYVSRFKDDCDYYKKGH